jgi:hypothetical protein
LTICAVFNVILCIRRLSGMAAILKGRCKPLALHPMAGFATTGAKTKTWEGMVVRP